MNKKERATRSDKKVDSKPTIATSLKECIYRLSYITNKPVKEVSENICIAGISSRKVIDLLSEHFRRDFRMGNTFYIGEFERKSLQIKKSKEPTCRISIRFRQSDYERIKALAYALDVTPSKATAILLDTCINYTNYINQFTKEYVKGQLDEKRMRELRKILVYLNRNNPHEEKVTWSTLLSYIFDEVKTNATTMTNALNDWIDKTK